MKLSLVLTSLLLVVACNAPVGEDVEADEADLSSSRTGIDFSRIRFSVTAPYIQGRPTMCITPGYEALEYSRIRFVGTLRTLREVSTFHGLLNPQSEICVSNSTIAPGDRIVVDFVRTDWRVVRATFTARWDATYQGGPISERDLVVRTLPAGSAFEAQAELARVCRENPFACSRP